MYLEEIKFLLEKKISPKLFRFNSEIYGFHYGQTQKNKIIKKVMLTIDLDLKSIHYAVKNKINLIISHYGLFNNPIQNFNNNLVNKLSLLSKYPISIFVLNTSFIAAEGGISETIMDTLYLKLDKTFNVKNKKGINIPIGRVCLPKSYPNGKNTLKLEDLIKRIKMHLDIVKISYVGDLNQIINKICIIGGDLLNIEFLEKALKYECDCFISGRIDHFEAIYAKEIGICLIKIPYYKNEIIAMKKLSNILSLKFPYDEFYLFESEDPIKTYL